MTKRYTIQATVIVLLLLLAGVAQATIVTYNFNAPVDFSYATTGTIYCPQFNPALGTLTDVTLFVAHSGGATFNLDNDSDYAILAHADMARAWTITDGFGGLNQSTTHSTITTPDQSLSADNGDGMETVDWTSPDGYIWSNVSFNDPVEANHVTSGLSNYYGVGNTAFNVNVTTFQNTIDFVGSPPNQYTSQIFNATPAGLELNGYVQYAYDPASPSVPEPTTLALLGIGVIGMGLRARRRKTAAAA